MTKPLGFEADIDLKPEVFPFFDEDTFTFSYIVKDPESNACAIIDSVMDIDYPSGTIRFEGADEIISHVQDHKLDVQWIIETHAHADHLSAAPYLQEKLGGQIGIGVNIKIVQEVFGKVFNAGTQFERDGSQFDHLFEEGESYKIGGMTAHAIHTPGHTPACMTHVIGDAAFVGDTIFMPEGGTARADFPGGNAAILFGSIRRLLTLPEETRLFMCHDYPEERELEFVTTVADEKKKNIHVHDGITEEQFVVMREKRDATLEMPRLILPSLQVNMRAGHLPEPEDNNMVYLKLPINAFDK